MSNYRPPFSGGQPQQNYPPRTGSSSGQRGPGPQSATAGAAAVFSAGRPGSPGMPPPGLAGGRGVNGSVGYGDAAFSPMADGGDDGSGMSSLVGNLKFGGGSAGPSGRSYAQMAESKRMGEQGHMEGFMNSAAKDEFAISQDDFPALGGGPSMYGGGLDQSHGAESFGHLEGKAQPRAANMGGVGRDGPIGGASAHHSAPHLHFGQAGDSGQNIDPAAVGGGAQGGAAMQAMGGGFIGWNAPQRQQQSSPGQGAPGAGPGGQSGEYSAVPQAAGGQMSQQGGGGYGQPTSAITSGGATGFGSGGLAGNLSHMNGGNSGDSPSSPPGGAGLGGLGAGAMSSSMGGQGQKSGDYPSSTATGLTGTTAAMRGGLQDESEESAAKRFGLLGLLSVIKMTDEDLNMLALGSDLTTMGLNLTSSECLYNTFGSPYSGSLPRPRDLEFALPSCYAIREPIPSALGKIKLFSDETLFYIFYCMPRDKLQIVAAHELYNRDWRYHKEKKLWFTRVSGSVTETTETYEKGTYIYFDVNLWQKVQKDLVLMYEHLEELSGMPPPQQGQAQQQAQQPAAVGARK
eukprot:Clim_evm20s2 gene=Clim_evmTU20s2